jgi:hypothetical protein
MKAIRSYPIIGAVIAQVAAALMVIAVSAAWVERWIRRNSSGSGWPSRAWWPPW